MTPSVGTAYGGFVRPVRRAGQFCRVFIAFENRENHIRNFLRALKRTDFHFTDILWKTRKRQETRKKICSFLEQKRRMPFYIFTKNENNFQK